MVCHDTGEEKKVVYPVKLDRRYKSDDLIFEDSEFLPQSETIVTFRHKFIGFVI